MADNNVLVGAPIVATGGVLMAPTGSTRPTDATTPVDPAYDPMGYIGEDGLTMEMNRSIEKIRAWGGDTVRTIQNEHDLTFTFTFLDTTAEVAKAVFGEENVSDAEAGFSVNINSKTLPRKAWVFDMKDGEALVRVEAANAQITEVGEITFVHSDVIKFEVTLECFPGEDGNKATLHVSNGDSDD